MFLQEPNLDLIALEVHEFTKDKYRVNFIVF